MRHSVTLLNAVNSQRNPTNPRGMGWIAHRDGCRDIARARRYAGVYLEATGVTDLDAYMADNYGPEAGFESAWTVANGVHVAPCTSR